MTTAITLESLFFHGVADRADRRRQFVTESTNAPWAKRLCSGDRIETTGPAYAEEMTVYTIQLGVEGIEEGIKAVIS